VIDLHEDMTCTSPIYLSINSSTQRKDSLL